LVSIAGQESFIYGSWQHNSSDGITALFTYHCNADLCSAELHQRQPYRQRFITRRPQAPRYLSAAPASPEKLQYDTHVLHALGDAGFVVARTLVMMTLGRAPTNSPIGTICYGVHNLRYSCTPHATQALRMRPARRHASWCR
jgi:hypothetical protein